jgi:quercetin dioxygenase-like cupin family protein
VGYHQVKGEPKQVIKKGDVVKCPPNAVHWHGASRDSSMSHIYLVPNTEKGVVDWMEPVSEAEFLK